ncbi:hypothetical protein WDW86_15740 [Bdellovibrionota bacterium FG-2]
MNKTKEEIRHQAYKCMLEVENHYPDHVPRPVLTYYLMLSLIYMGSLDRFYEQHGWIEIDRGDVEEGKNEFMRHGRLTGFEIEVIEMLNNESKRRENVRQPHVLAPSENFRAYG